MAGLQPASGDRGRRVRRPVIDSTEDVLACHRDVIPGRFRGERLALLVGSIPTHNLVQTGPGAPRDEEYLGLVLTLQIRPVLDLNRGITFIEEFTSWE